MRKLQAMRCVLKVVTSRYHSGKFFPNEDATRDWNGCPFDHVAPSFLRRRIKVDQKKAKTITKRVMLNHSRTIKVFCEAMSTSA